MVNDDGRPVIGLVGAGGISRAHMPGLLRLAGEVCGFSRDGAENLAREFSHGPVPVRIASSLDELLERCSIIDVVTPTPTHVGIVRAALEAGRDVICEKPMARTATAAQALAGLAADNGLHLYPAHVVRYFPEYRVLKDAVDSGRLGDLAVLRFVRSGAFPATPWFADDQASGGIAMVAHPVRFSSDFAALQAQYRSGVLVEYCDGVVAGLDSSWSIPQQAPAWGGLRMSVLGTGGTVDVESLPS